MDPKEKEAILKEKFSKFRKQQNIAEQLTPHENTEETPEVTETFKRIVQGINDESRTPTEDFETPTPDAGHK